MKRPWIETETDAGLLHARPGTPDRWDVRVDRAWAMEGAVSRRRMARQVRQDLWRAAQTTRGFVPRVLVARQGDNIQITGGGVLMTGRAAPGLTARLADRLAAILDNPQNRRRWAAHARARAKT